MREPSRPDSTRPDRAPTEEIGVLRSPTLAETLPPSGLPGLVRPAAATEQLTQGWRPPSTQTEPAAAGLNQLERLSALVDREVRKSGPSPAPAQNATPTVPTPAKPASPAPPPDDEEPLEAYLSRFMERLTAKQSVSAEPITKTVPTPYPTSPKAPVPAEPPKPAPVWPSSLLPAVPLTSSLSSPPAQPIPAPAPANAPTPAPAPAPAPAVREPTKPPECRQALTAMREVANENARCAVAEHATHHLSGQARLVLAVAAGTSLISSLLAVAAIGLHSRGCLWASIAVACVAGLAACRFFLMCRKFQTSNVVWGDV